MAADADYADDAAACRAFATPLTPRLLDVVAATLCRRYAFADAAPRQLR